MQEPNRLLIFDLKGKLAHFRKFYTNSSSLSYSFPPRTTLSGLIAGMLGKERDSYYEEFAINNCKIALSIRKPIKKIMQTVNYIRTKKEEDGYTKNIKVIEHSIKRKINKYPTPLELVVPSKFKDEIVYRVYLCHNDNTIMDDLYLLLRNGKTRYPVFLGLSEFLGYVEFIDDVPLQNIKEHKSEEPIEIFSVCNSAHISEFEYGNDIDTLQYIDEKMPLEFARGREIKKTASLIHEKNQKPIRARLKVPYIQITYKDQEKVIKENITFME